MNIVDLIGNTPSIEVSKVGNSRLIAKLEYFNPTGSIKDRAAYYMIKEAIARGDINANTEVIEPTSGNTGIGLSMVCKAYNLKCTIVMPENMSKERIAMIRAFGADIILTPAVEGMAGAVAYAKKLTEEKGGYMPCQFDNKDNIKAHVETTAPEVFSKHPDTKWVVAGVGSGGTAMGFKQYIEANNIDAKVCAVEPASSPLMTTGTAGKHKIQGIGANFIPSLVDKSKFDSILTVTDEEAFEGARELAKKFGIFGGISAGANYVAAKRLANDSVGDIVFIVPDSGARYMSMNLYE